ncbi:hypothetical protein [Salinibacter altiplanensis]|uniref:hypothetical protein n=1 Tax=Salinibacter altiplanensis TaxID=1803181 RepID=UPI000C9FF143|nr:hypothetical protein [Salinibacter altiplanensis]
MLGLPWDVWATMLFCVLAFFGVSILTLVYTLRQEERKMTLLESERALDTYSPRALRDLKDWIETHPEPTHPDVDAARSAHDDCVDTLRATDQHFYAWSRAEVDRLDTI